MRRGPVSAAGVGGTNLRASYVELGAGPYPTSGSVRLSEGGSIVAKRSGVLSDRLLLQVINDSEWHLGPQANLGAPGGDPTLYFQGGGISMFLNTSAMYSLGSTRLDIQSPSEIRFSNGAPDTCLVYRQTKTSGNGATMIFRGGGASAASANGGAVFVDTGRHGAGGTPGVGSLRGNRDDATLDVCLSWDTSGSAARLGFYGATPAVKPTVSGSRALPEQALADLLAELATLGLITNSSTV